MAFAAPLLPLAGGLIGVGVSKLLTKAPKPVQSTPRATRFEARERAAQRDSLARRQGTNANRRVGFGAGESFTGPKRSLLGRDG